MKLLIIVLSSLIVAGHTPAILANNDSDRICNSNKIAIKYHDDFEYYLDANRTRDTYVSDNTFLSDYYFHLNDNRPRNTLGICGYTAISMLLSYYDSFWNDEIIPEQYESALTNISSSIIHSSSQSVYNSHGVYNNVPVNADTIQDYEDAIYQANPGAGPDSLYYKQTMDSFLSVRLYNQISNGTFLGYLFQIGINLGIITPHYDINGNVLNPSKYLTEFGVLYEETLSILNTYLFNNSYLFAGADLETSQMSTYEQSSPDYAAEKTRIRNEIIAILQSGRPVIVGGNGWRDKNNNGIKDNGEEYGHVAVAYKYDSTNNKIYGNMGWNDKNNYPINTCTYYNIDNYFNVQIHDYFALTFDSDSPQKRTANYYISDKTAYYFPGNNSIYNTISPTDYGFPDSYNQTEVSSNLTIHSIEENGVDKIVNVKRMRTGYIHGECVNLSTKRKSPGIAYLELTFPQQVKRITIDISWWSNNEMVSPLNSQYRIQSKEGGLYYDYADIWYEGISTDRTHPTKLIVEFEQDIYTIRFYGSTTDYINDRNKGRLSIFDMTIEYWDSL